MNERPTNRRGPIGWLTKWPWWYWTALFTAAYVASVGPVSRIAQEGLLDEGVARSFYYPLAIVAMLFPPAGDALAWYISIWRSLAA